MASAMRFSTPDWRPEGKEGGQGALVQTIGFKASGLPPPQGLDSLMRRFVQMPTEVATVINCFGGDTADPLDMALARHLLSLNGRPTLRTNSPGPRSPMLQVRRLATSRYEIEGRQVRLLWGDTGNSSVQGDPAPALCEDGDSMAEPLVYEDLDLAEVGDALPPRTSGTLLSVYLQQAAHVAAALRGQAHDSPAVARIPPRLRLTFAVMGLPSAQAAAADAEAEEQESASDQDSQESFDGGAGGRRPGEAAAAFSEDTFRFNCMVKACEEARLRAQAADNALLAAAGVDHY